MQSMDFQTLAARRAKKDGWNIFLTRSTSVASMNPLSGPAFSAACYPKAWVGWPCDPELEKLRDAFALAGDEKERKVIAEQIQVRAMEVGTHLPLGEYVIKVATRMNITGFVTGFFTVYWNVDKQ
jgi:peptide/nickel transport system substrate-binding protein